jgi:hypothetical protein
LFPGSELKPTKTIMSKLSSPIAVCGECVEIGRLEAEYVFVVYCGEGAALVGAEVDPDSLE